jgi:hypothetical protein
VESLLSTAGTEIGILGDFEQGVRMLTRFSFRLLPPLPHADTHAQADWEKGGGVEIVQESATTFVVEMRLWPARNPEHSLEEWVPEALLTGERLIRVFPVMFSKGINEMQALSNLNFVARRYELHVRHLHACLRRARCTCVVVTTLWLWTLCRDSPRSTRRATPFFVTTTRASHVTIATTSSCWRRLWRCVASVVRMCC